MNKNIKQNVLQAIKFTLFSMSAGIIQAGVFALLKEIIHLIYWPSYLIALIASVLWNFTLNRNFTFKEAPNVTKAMLQIGAYYLMFTPLSTMWGDYFSKLNINEYLILFITMLINLITEFCVYRFIVFKKKKSDSVKVYS